MADDFVSYLRVSTVRQGRSGLGLEAQRKAVTDYLSGGRGNLLAEFVEVESGKENAWPELQRALHRAKVTCATLVVAKLDRLSRNAAFLMTLRDSGAEFVAADLPDANTLTIGIMASVAQHEREAISRRTKEALAAAKARGVRLGNPNGARAFGGAGGQSAAVAALKASADARARDIAPIVADIRAAGAMSVRAIAAELNARKIRTARGGRWYAGTVANLLARQ